MQWESNTSFCSFELHIPSNTVVLCNAEIPNIHILLVWEKKSEIEEFAQPKLVGGKEWAVSKCSILRIRF